MNNRINGINRIHGTCIVTHKILTHKSDCTVSYLGFGGGKRAQNLVNENDFES